MPIAPEDRAAIEALHHAWLETERRGDSRALLEFCTPDPVWLPPGGPALCGRRAILAWLANQSPIAVLRIETSDITIGSTSAFAWKAAAFRTTCESPVGSCPQSMTGTHAWLLRRDAAGTWKVAVVTWTIDAAGVG